MSDLIELGDPDSLEGTFVDQLRKKDAEIERLRAVMDDLTKAVGDYMQYQEQDDFERMEAACTKALAALEKE